MIGEELGSYRIVEPLGRGGMASIFVGEHNVLGHRVAIKVLSDLHLQNPTSRKRFLNEARAVARVRHPSIVELHDFGYGDDGVAYMAMELLKGEDLRTRLRKGELAEIQITTFGSQIAGALAVAHGHGIVHRDLKPSNIFLVADSESEVGERAKILDFGIAKQMPRSDRETEDLTATGILIGTPAYMSPEQCVGGDLDARSDIYSLGVVTYRMATGQLPFEGAGSDDPLLCHLVGTPPPPIELRPELTPSLDQLIVRCMAREPGGRFQSMVEVGEAFVAVAREGRGPPAAEPHDDDTAVLDMTKQFARPAATAAPAPAPATEPAIPSQDELPTTDLVTPRLAPPAAVAVAPPAAAPAPVGFAPPPPSLAPVAMPDRLANDVAALPPQRSGGWLTRSRLALVGGAGAVIAVLLALWIAAGGEELSDTRPVTPHAQAPASGSDARVAEVTADAGPDRVAVPTAVDSDLMRRAEDAFVAGNFAAALESCEQVIRREPSHQRAAVICAISSCERGDRDRGRDYAEQIRSDKDSAAVAAICEDRGKGVRAAEPSRKGKRPRREDVKPDRTTDSKHERDKPPARKPPPTFDDIEVPVLD